MSAERERNTITPEQYDTIMILKRLYPDNIVNYRRNLGRTIVTVYDERMPLLSYEIGKTGGAKLVYINENGGIKL